MRNGETSQFRLVQIVLRFVFVVTGLARAARCHELLSAAPGVTLRRDLGKAGGGSTKVIQLALEIVHVGPDIGLGSSGALFSAGRKSSLNVKLCSVMQVICPPREAGGVPFDFAFHHVTHRCESHA